MTSKNYDPQCKGCKSHVLQECSIYEAKIYADSCKIEYDEDQLNQVVEQCPCKICLVKSVCEESCDPYMSNVQCLKELERSINAVI